MNETQLAVVLQFSVVAFLWSILVFKVIPDARLDGFRQKMFSIRDEMFDYAADGNIAFDHPAYVMLRHQMNGFIRHGHQLTVFRCLMTVAIRKVEGVNLNTSWHSELQKSLDSLPDPTVRETLMTFYQRSMWLAAKRLLLGSPVLWFMTLSATGTDGGEESVHRSNQRPTNRRDSTRGIRLDL
jgi:hypothetical protein